MEMMDVVNRQRLRHGHMVNITKDIMLQGMQADFLQIDRLSERVIEKARRAKSVRATSKGGTHIVAEMSPELKWVSRKAITPGTAELAENPRSRSAQLRIWERV